MDLTPLLTANTVIKLHVATVLPAAVIGAVQLVAPKGTVPHRALGYLFIALMLATAVTSFFIREPSGGFSWIHLFIPLTLVGLGFGFWFIRRGNIRGHQRAMTGLYIGAILTAGLFTFLPGRIMHRIFFGG